MNFVCFPLALCVLRHDCYCHTVLDFLWHYDYWPVINTWLFPKIFIHHLGPYVTIFTLFSPHTFISNIYLLLITLLQSVIQFKLLQIRDFHAILYISINFYVYVYHTNDWQSAMQKERKQRKGLNGTQGKMCLTVTWNDIYVVKYVS